MGLVVCIVLILLGALAASTVIIAKKPSAAELLAKIRPYQGYLGVFALVIAILYIFSIPGLLRMFSLYPVYSLAILASWVVLGLLGLFYSYDLVQLHLLKDKPEASAKLAETQAKIARIQVPLGLTGIGLGLLAFVVTYMR